MATNADALSEDEEDYGYDTDTEAPPTCDVFITHSNEQGDKFFAHNLLKPALTQRGFSTTIDDDNFECGRQVVHEITRAVRNCKKTLIVMTKDSVESVWCSFEMLLAFEESQKRSMMSVIILVLKQNGQDFEMPHLHFFNMAPTVEVENYTGTLTSETLNELQKCLKDEVPISNILPAGNVAHGQVWSHFTGLLQHMLPALEGKIKETQWYKDNPGRFPIKLYELIPDDCVCPSRIEDDTGRIKHVGSLSKIVMYRAGNERVFALPIYSVTDDDGTVYYCIAEYPSVIGAMKKMEDEGLSDLTKEDRRLQINRYYYTMNTLLTHGSMEKCHNRAKLLPFNGLREKPSDVLLSAIKVDLKLQTEVSNRPFDRLASVEMQYDFAAYVSFYQEDPRNKEIADDIIKYLEDKGLKICWNQGNKSEIFDSDIDRCRWFILILTKSALHDQLFSCHSLCVLTKHLSDRKISVIPVMDNIREEKIPQELRSVTYIDTRCKNGYLDPLYHYVKGEVVPFSLETHLPAGDVAYGLAWGLVMNYLQLILNPAKGKGFKDRIEDAFQKKNVQSYRCPKKLYILVPRGCECKPKVADADSRISHFTTFEVMTINQTGVINRSYSCDIYKATDQNGEGEYYFVGQFAEAVHCLWEMNKWKIAGLNYRKMLREARRFCRIVRAILDCPVGTNVTEKCEIVQYDDHKESLADVMIRKVKEDKS